jgi:putative heme-binding domain-containing protein
MACATAGAQTTRPGRPAPRDRYSKYAMVHQGDPEAGKKLFEEPQKIACSNCHTTDGKGGKAGPDLFAIGDKFGRDDLIEQILFPSKTIAVGFTTTVIRTKSGDLFTGIVKQSSEQSIGLMGADGKLVQIKTSDIDQKRNTDISLMPEGLEGSLTQQQFADLISYLTTLKAPQSTVALFHGQPLEIPALKTPLVVTQINSSENRFKHPVWFGEIPGQTGSYLVLEHETGTIWRYQKTGSEEQRLSSFK